MTQTVGIPHSFLTKEIQMTDKAILDEMLRLQQAIKDAETAAVAYADTHGLQFELDAADGNFGAVYFGEKHKYRDPAYDPDEEEGEDDFDDDYAWAASDIRDGDGWYSSWFSR